MIEHAAGPILAKILEDLGEKAVVAGVVKAFKKMTKRADVKLDPAEVKKLEKEVESLIQPATFEDVKQFDPKFQAITVKMHHHGPSRKGAKKAPAKKAARKASAKKAVKKAVKKAAKKA
jgi:hypothetical protein